MTEEALEQGRKLLDKIGELKKTKEKITPYLHEVVTMNIAIQKGLMGYALDDEKLFCTLTTDSPLFLAIASSLQDMIDELQHQFDTLGMDEKSKVEPIKKTSFWEKVWGKGGKK